MEEDAPLSFGELTVDPARREVRLLGEEVPLTALEFELLAALASRPGFVFSRSRLLERVWGENYFGSDHVVDVHVANLRKKLKDDPSDPRRSDATPRPHPGTMTPPLIPCTRSNAGCTAPPCLEPSD